MFWDNKKIEEQRKKMFEEQRKKRLEQDNQLRQRAIQLKKKKKALKLNKMRREEEEEQEREEREEAETANSLQQSESKKVFIPPSLNRGFGMDLGGKSIVEKIHPTSAASGKDTKKETTKKSSGWSPHGGDDSDDTGSGTSGSSNIPKLQRPF